MVYLQRSIAIDYTGVCGVPGDGSERRWRCASGNNPDMSPDSNRDAPRGARKNCQAHVTRGGGLWGVGGGDCYLEFGAAAVAVAGGDGAVVELQDSAADGQTEAEAGAVWGG